MLHVIRLAVTAAPAVLLFAILQADEPTVPKVSQFAPPEDLKSQVNYYLGRLDEALADPNDYDEAKQSRVAKDSAALAALGLSLAMHDQDSHFRSGALVKAAERLGESGSEHAKASAAAAEVKKAAAGSDDPAGAVQWGKVASIAELMKQVPIVNNGLKRGLEPARFQKQATQSAGQAATLAAIAQAAMFDEEYVGDAADAARLARALCPDAGCRGRGQRRDPCRPARHSRRGHETAGSELRCLPRQVSRGQVIAASLARDLGARDPADFPSAAELSA